MISTTLFSPGCTINAVACDVVGSDGVIIFVCDELGADHSEFMKNPAIKKLSDKFNSIFFDARGTGESTYPLVGKIAEVSLCDDIKCVVDYAKLTFPNQPVFLFTASYGTIATLLFVDKYKGEIDKIIVDSPILWPACPEMIAEIMDSWKKNAKRTFSPELAEEIHLHHSTSQGLAELMVTEQTKNFMAGNQPLKKNTEYFSYYYAMQDFIATCDLRLIVHDLTVNTLFLQGEKDKLCPPMIVQETIKAYKNPYAYLSEFGEFVHKIYMQTSDEFARICTEFYLG